MPEYMFAIDPGQTLGYAYDQLDEVVMSGYFNLKQGEKTKTRKRAPSLWGDINKRPVVFYDFLTKFVPQHIQVIAFEDKGEWGERIPLREFVMFKTTVILWAHLHNKEFYPIDVSDIKSVVTGEPHADKLQVKACMKLLTNIQVRNHNEQDALAILYASKRSREFTKSLEGRVYSEF